MSAAVQQCPLQNSDPDDPCQDLAKQIDEFINRDKRQNGNQGTHGLKHRFREQIEGRNGPGTTAWDTHDEAIRNQQRGLRDRLNQFNKNNCGNKAPIPKDAWQWATRPAPQPEEWTGPAERSIEEPSPGWRDWAYWEEATGLTGAALVIYLIVSEGSRVAFPVRNLVPVP
jgi:hypothetical protein